MRNPFRKHSGGRAAPPPGDSAAAPSVGRAARGPLRSDPSDERVETNTDETNTDDSVGLDTDSLVPHESGSTDGTDGIDATGETEAIDPIEDTQASAEAVPVPSAAMGPQDSLLLTTPVRDDDVDEVPEDHADPGDTKRKPKRRPKDPVKEQARRFRRRRWRRRLSAWKWVIALVLAIILLSAGIWAVYFSTFFQVQEVEVQGADSTTYVTPNLVRKYADAPMGKPLLTADLDSVRTRVRANLPPLRTVDVTRKWPHTILIQVTMRKPVAVVSIGGKLRALDAEGAVFLRAKTIPKGLPRVSSPAGTDADALSEGAKVASALPKGLAGKVSYVRVETVDSISLKMRDGRTVIWGGAADSEIKAKELAVLMKHAPRSVQYDVSVPSAPQSR